MKVPRVGMKLVRLISINTRINSIKKEMSRVTNMTWACLIFGSFPSPTTAVSISSSCWWCSRSLSWHRSPRERVHFWCRIFLAVFFSAQDGELGVGAVGRLPLGTITISSFQLVASPLNISCHLSPTKSKETSVEGHIVYCNWKYA